MFLGGDTNIDRGSGKTFTLDRNDLASLAGSLDDGYFGDTSFWKEVVVTFEAGNVSVIDERMVNGDFSDGVNEWTLTGGAALNSDGNPYMMAFNNSDAFEQTIEVEPGYEYTISFDVISFNNQGGYVMIDRGSSTASYTIIDPITSTGRHEVLVTPTVADLRIYFTGRNANSACFYDNVSVQRVKTYQGKSVRQRQTLVFRGNDTANISFSSTAMIGEWGLRNVIIEDRDMGRLVLSPSQIPDIELYKLTIQ